MLSSALPSQSLTPSASSFIDVCVNLTFSLSLSLFQLEMQGVEAGWSSNLSHSLFLLFYDSMIVTGFAWGILHLRIYSKHSSKIGLETTLGLGMPNAIGLPSVLLLWLALNESQQRDARCNSLFKCSCFVIWCELSCIEKVCTEIFTWFPSRYESSLGPDEVHKI